MLSLYIENLYCYTQSTKLKQVYDFALLDASRTDSTVCVAHAFVWDGMMQTVAKSIHLAIFRIYISYWKNEKPTSDSCSNPRTTNIYPIFSESASFEILLITENILSKKIYYHYFSSMNLCYILLEQERHKQIITNLRKLLCISYETFLVFYTHDSFYG